MFSPPAAVVSWPYFDPEYETLSSRINPPRYVNSANKHGILLEVVQELTDLDLNISKAYIASDGGWFMDVFHVTDQQGNKIREADVLEHIQKALRTRKSKVSAEFSRCAAGKFVGAESSTEHTVLELTGKERPGLLSEVFAVVTDMNCRVHASEFWTHNKRVACVVYITDEDTSGPLTNVKKLESIKQKLHLVMQGDDERRNATTTVADGTTHTERRLHQLMLADEDYEANDQLEKSKSMAGKEEKPTVTVQTPHHQRGYSVINVRCKDRPKLLFDTVCTLTDMQFDVFHATATPDSSGPWALQEFHIRQTDGRTLSPDAEEHVKKCLEAAIERRSSKGLRLELCTSDRVGLLSDVTQIFRENGLSVTRADVSTQGDKAMDVFYVTDASGNPVDKTVEAIKRNYPILGVKESSPSSISSSPESSSSSNEQATSPLNSFLKTSESFFHGITTGWKMSTVA
ncbi:unnamed protein product [Sphagnum troendelagicum]